MKFGCSKFRFKILSLSKVIEEKPLLGLLEPPPPPPPLDQEGLIGSSRSRKEINDLGIDSYNICQLTNTAISVVEERVNAKIAVNDMHGLSEIKKEIGTSPRKHCIKRKHYTVEQGL